MAEDEAILYDLIQELLRNRTVSDATYARAVAKFGEQGVVDAVSISGYYTMIGMLLNTARTPLAGVGRAAAGFSLGQRVARPCLGLERERSRD